MVQAEGCASFMVQADHEVMEKTNSRGVGSSLVIEGKVKAVIAFWCRQIINEVMKKTFAMEV